MIALTPISDRIKETLNKKTAMLQTGHRPIFKNWGWGEWTNGNLVVGERMTGEGNTAENYMFTRTTWIRMTSLISTAWGDQPIILMGGELNSAGNMASAFSTAASHGMHLGLTGGSFSEYDMFHDRGGKYSRSSGEAGGEMPYRPLPGIKDVSVEYKGGGMKLGATRTGEINWICWTWEELDRLTKHFLAQRSPILLEWGWSGIGELKSAEKNMLYDLLDPDTGKFDATKVENLDQGILSHIQGQNGHYDAMSGIVQDFTWNVNENGGFECTTTMVAKGISLFNDSGPKKGMDEQLSGNIIIAGVKAFYAEAHTLKENILTVQREILATANEKILTNFPIEITKELYDLYMEPNYGQMTLEAGYPNHKLVSEEEWDEPTGFSKGIKYWVVPKDYEGPTTMRDYIKIIEIVHETEDAKELTDKDILRLAEDLLKTMAPFVIFREYMKDFENQIEHIVQKGKDKLKGSIVKFKYLASPVVFRPAGTVDATPYEDGVPVYNKPYDNPDIASIYGSFNYFVSWGWFEDNVLSRFFGKALGGEIYSEVRSINQKVDSEGNFVTDNGKPIFEQNTFLNSEALITVDSKEWLIPNEGDKIITKTEFQKNGGQLIKNFEPIPIRSILFNAGFLSSKLSGGTFTDLSSTIGTIWNKFSSSYGGVYKFNVEFDDNSNRVSIVESGYTRETVYNLLNTATGRKEVFIFPVWEDGSIVKSQNITAKLPNRMQVASMYGSSIIAGDDAAEEGDYENSVARSWNQIMVDTSSDQKLLEYPSYSNRPFGNYSGDYNEVLVINNPIKGTTIGPSIMTALEEAAKKRLGMEMTKSSKDYKAKSKKIKKLQDEMENFLPDYYKKGREGLTDHWYKEDGTTGFKSLHYSLKEHLKITMKRILRSDGEKGIIPRTNLLIPIDFELEIDGTGGMFPGNSFHSSYLGSQYKRSTIFQMVRVDHKIDSSGWFTTIKGQIRAMPLAIQQNPPGYLESDAGTDETDIPDKSGEEEEIPVSNWGLGVWPFLDANWDRALTNKLKSAMGEDEYGRKMSVQLGQAPDILYQEGDDIPSGSSAGDVKTPGHSTWSAEETNEEWKNRRGEYWDTHSDLWE